MKAIQTIRVLIAALATITAPCLAYAQDAVNAPAQKTIGASTKDAMVPSLAVINAQSASLQGNVLTMSGVSANSIVFADRPVRAAGHVLTKELLKDWDENGTFAKDPPNATISVFSDNGASVKDAVVVLTKPKLENDKVTFEVSVLEGDLSNASGASALFIDWFRAGGYAGAAGGWGHVAYGGYHPAWHGAWYAHPYYGAAAGAAAVGGAAIGAAAANSYYAPGYNGYDTNTNCGLMGFPPC